MTPMAPLAMPMGSSRSFFSRHASEPEKRIIILYLIVGSQHWIIDSLALSQQPIIYIGDAMEVVLATTVQPVTFIKK